MNEHESMVRRMHFDALIEDYRWREQETLKMLDLTHQAFYASLRLTGFFLAAAPFIIEYKLPVLFGIFPIFLSLSALLQIRYRWTVSAHDSYLKDVLIPSLKSHIGPGSDDLMLWKSGGYAAAYPKGCLRIPIKHSRILVPIFSGIMFFVLFLAYGWGDAGTFMFWMFFAVDLVGVVYVLSAAILFRAYLLRDLAPKQGYPRKPNRILKIVNILRRIQRTRH